MHWKRYKALSLLEKRNESYYIIGLDIGNDSSGIAFYNLIENKAEAIDLSGGYGKPSIPTVMQYISETKEWVYGEYALLNRGAGTEVTLTGLMDRLGRYEYVEIDHKLIRPAEVDSLCGNATKAREVLGWKPEVGFEKLIEMMVAADLEETRKATRSSLAQV